MITYTVSMAPEYGLEVVRQQDDNENVVRAATYKLVAEEGGNKAEWLSRVEFAEPTGEFKPFAELTEADLLAWTEALCAEQIENMKQHLAVELAEKQIVAVKAPWEA